jgi:hypothetical protein
MSPHPSQAARDDAPSGPGSGPPDGRLEHIGPITIGAVEAEIAGASVFRGTTQSGGRATVFHWGREGLAEVGVARLAQLIESLQEANVVGLAPVVHGFVGHEEAAVAFACLHGERLERRLVRGVASPVEALVGALNIAGGLEQAAGLGVVIGRWDPSRVLSLGERPGWVVTAPGIYALRAGGGRPTLRGVIEAAACAPEVATGALDFDAATPDERVAAESYALGATIFYAVTGALPLGGADPEAYLRSQLGSAPRPLAEIAPELDRFRRLDEVLRRCLERAPGARPQSYAELRALLETALREAERLDDDAAFLPARLSDTMELRRVRLREPEPLTRPQRAPERVIQVGALLLLVAILVFLILWQTRARSRAAGEPAEGATSSVTRSPAPAATDGELQGN